MFKLLVPVDGSASSARTIDHLLARLACIKSPVELHLLNVQSRLHGDVGMFLDSGQIRDFHREEGLKALDAARQKLNDAGVAYQFHIGVGEPAEVIVQYAKEKACDEIVIGTRGLGSIASLFLGSVASQVIRLSEIPVLLVK